MWSLTSWVSRNFPFIRSGSGKAHVTAFFIRGDFARSTFLLLGDTRALLSLGISFAAVSVSRRDMWGLKRSFSVLRARVGGRTQWEPSGRARSANWLPGFAQQIMEDEDVIHTFLYTMNSLLA